MLRAYQNLSKPFESNQIERTAPQPAQQQARTLAQTHTYTETHRYRHRHCTQLCRRVHVNTCIEKCGKAGEK